MTTSRGCAHVYHLRDFDGVPMHRLCLGCGESFHGVQPYCFGCVQTDDQLDESYREWMANRRVTTLHRATRALVTFVLAVIFVVCCSSIAFDVGKAVLRHFRVIP